jgi:predicted amidohydrolase YtcJ
VKRLILFNANVLTMDPISPNAQLIFIEDGKIAEVTGNERLEELKQSGTGVLDCRGRTILPGFVDNHLHLHGFAESLISINLSPRCDVHSISDLQTRIRQESKNHSPGEWIRARGYNEFYLAEKRHPNRWDLDEATSRHPIKLTHRSTRAHVLNSMALRLANISRESPDPPDGLIERDLASGEPTGLLFGMNDYLSKIVPPMSMERMSAAVRMADEKLSSLGITSIHDVSARNNFQRISRFRDWKSQGVLKSRVQAALGIEGFRECAGSPCFDGTERDPIPLTGVKIIVHETTGRLMPTQDELNQLVLEIYRSGQEVILHAIEGRTIDAACSAIEYAMAKSSKPDPRPRVEHCSVCTPDQAKRMATLGISVVTQPSFIYYNGDRYLRTVPKHHLDHLYPIAMLIRSGVRVAASSDGPIVPPDPLIGIYSAVTRKTEGGEIVSPEEGIRPAEAIRMYTREVGKARFEEGGRGSITPGKPADLVVLSGDPLQVPPDGIKDLTVEMTILNGEVVWKRTFEGLSS